MPAPLPSDSARLPACFRPHAALPHLPLPALLSAALVVAVLPIACADGPDGPSPMAPSVFRSADSLKDEGRYREAAARYTDLADSLASRGDTAALWRAVLWEAYARLKTGDLDAGRSGLRRADSLTRGDPRREGWTRWVRSVLLDRQGRLDSALAEAEGTLALARRSDDQRLLAAAYNALGRIHSLSGRYQEALEVHERLLELRRKPGTPPRSRALALNEIGIDYRHLGRLHDAIGAYEEALGIYRELEDPEGVAMVLYNLSNVHLSLGELRTAREQRIEALGWVEEIGHVRGQGFLHNGLGDLYLQVGNHRAARRHLRRALEVNREAGLLYGETLARQNLGRLELATGALQAAEGHLLAALSAADSAGLGKERSTVRATLARLEARRDRADAALGWARQAVALADSLNDPEVRYEALEALGIAREAVGRSEDAAAAYLEGVELLESWRGRLALGDLRMGVTDPRLGAYEGAIRVLVKRGEDAAAFEIAERARARLLLELMARVEFGGRRTGVGDGPSLISSTRRRLQQRYVGWTEARPDAGEAAERGTAVANESGLPPDIRQLTRRLEELESEARRRDPAAGAARWPEPRTLEEVRRGLIRPGRALLSYFWGERHVYGWWIGPDGVRASRLGAADSLAAPVDFLREAVAAPGGAVGWKPPARHVFQRFVAPLAPEPTAEVLVLPDGPLAHVPFEVLLSEADALPWGVRHRMMYGPSASVLHALASRKERPARGRSVLAVGNPEPGPAAGVAGGRRSYGSARAGLPRREPLPPLPHAAREARAIAEMYASEGSDVLVGPEATAPGWRQLGPGRYRYLHFATHARIDDRRPERTFVLLAGSRLDLSQIRGLRLDAELVTLSACATGLGPRVRGEGVIGLPHAFLAAGARGVVVSLWRLRDRAAADFMIDFYRRLHRGAPPAEALRRTRRAWLAGDGTTSHPSAWAPFVLVGGLAPTSSR